MNRPVIRLFDSSIILTRVDPRKRETSMLVRPRPGWEDLRAFLAGEVDVQPGGRPKLR